MGNLPVKVEIGSRTTSRGIATGFWLVAKPIQAAKFDTKFESKGVPRWQQYSPNVKLK